MAIFRKKKQDILNGPLYTQLLILFFPILFGTFFQQLYNTVDAIIVGNYVGKQALAAVGGTTGTLINLLVGFITGVGGGATVVVAQLYGKGDRDGVRKAVRSSMFLAVAMGFVVMVLGIVTAPLLLTWTNVPADIYDYSVQYMRIYFTGCIPLMIYNMGAGVLRAIGDSKRPLYFLIASTITNIILDTVFVKYWHMEVVGAALATVISILVAAVLTLFVLGRSEDCYHFVLKDISYEKNMLFNIIKIGIPTGLQSVMYTVTNILIQKSVNGFGTDSVAGFAALGKIDALFWMFSGALGTATMTVVGQNFGAGNIKRVKETVWKSVALFMAFSSIISALCYFFGDWMTALFTDDAEVIRIGYELTKFLAPCWLTFVFVEVFSSTIRACGDSLLPMLMTACGICVVRVVYILSKDFTNIIEIMYCYPISWLITDCLFLIYYFSGLWLKRCMKKREALISK